MLEKKISMLKISKIGVFIMTKNIESVFAEHKKETTVYPVRQWPLCRNYAQKANTKRLRCYNCPY